MDVAIGNRWEGFVDEAVKSGRYASASDVVTEGLRLVQEREAGIQALREILLPRMSDGTTKSVEEVSQAIEARLLRWEAERNGIP